jgi:hypothetical protein
MGLLIRYCACGEILATNDIREGLPCKKCQKKKGIKVEPLGKIVRKPNPAKNLWQEIQGGTDGLK